MSSEVVEFFEKLRTYSEVDISHLLAKQSDQPFRLDQNLAVSFSLGEELHETIMELKACGAELLTLAKPPLTQRLEQQLEQLDQLATRIAVVGQIKAGKSSFINAIAGRPAYLPTHVNPWTAVPTKLYFGVPGKAATGAIFEFFSASEWERLGRTVTAPIGVDAVSGTDRVSSPERAIHRRAMLRIGDQFHRLLGRAHRYDTITPKDLAHYLCAGPPVHEQSRHHLPGRYADITKVAHVFLPQEPFATPTILIDTPGLNDPSFIRLKTTQHVLENADIYIVVLSASQPMSLADVTLLRRLRGLEKRRLLIFINRIDELAGGPADVAAVEGHVRTKLQREFPEASASIISGSAHWANLALEGSASALRKSVTARPLASRLLDSPAPPPISALGEEGELEQLRMQVLEASGIPALICTLSDLMLDSFLASDGLRFVEMLKSAAEFSGTTARREISALQQMIDQTEPGAESMSFDMAIARLEKRLTEADLIKRNIAAIIEDTTSEIRSVQLARAQSLKQHLHTITGEFARQQKLQLLARLKEQSIRQWRCDTTVLVRQLETEFLGLFTSALQQIEAIQLKCMNTVRACLEHSQVAEGEQILVAQSAGQPDIRRVLPALGTTISVETSKPWWAGWWRTENSPQDKADELEEKIIADFRPIIDSLTEQVSAELAEFGDRASATLSDAVQSTVAGTRARLMDLKQRLYQHVQQGKLQKLELLSADYARSYKELTSLKSGCDAVIDRLQRVEARKAS